MESLFCVNLRLLPDSDWIFACHRGQLHDDEPAFIVEDGKLITGRWPGDTYLFAKRFIAKLEEVQRLY